MTNILALDQSTKITGWSVFDKETKNLISYGFFTESNSDLGIRLTNIKEKVLNLIEKFNITEVFFEDIQLQANVANNVKTFKSLAMVIGVLSQTLSEKNMPYTLVPSVTWKSYCQIKGATRPTQKSNAIKHIKEKYNKDVSSDEADAICMGEYAINKNFVLNWSN